MDRSAIRQQAATGSTRAARVVDSAVASVLRHWLLWINTIMAAYVALALLAPLLRATGHDRLARPIYLVYSLLCHQRPERSFHVHDEPMAFCQRDTAIFAALFAGGLLYALLRAYLVPLSVRALVALSLPMAIDGTTQLVGWRESTWELRVVTGSLFGLAVVGFVYPHLARGFALESPESPSVS